MCFRDHIYPVPYPTLVLVFDILFPGFGTIMQSYYYPGGCNYFTFFIGVAQTFLAGFLVGWIWSIWHGVSVY